MTLFPPKCGIRWSRVCCRHYLTWLDITACTSSPIAGTRGAGAWAFRWTWLRIWFDLGQVSLDLSQLDIPAFHWIAGGLHALERKALRSTINYRQLKEKRHILRINLMAGARTRGIRVTRENFAGMVHPSWSRPSHSIFMQDTRRFSVTGNFARTLRTVCFLVMAIELVITVPGLNGEVFAVGGAAGWTVPHKGMVNYTEWAAMLASLNVGDTLLFTYPSGEHNVVQVEEEDFNRCRSTSPLATFSDGQTLVNLPKEGRYWFICGFSGHCNLGQKFVIDVITLPAGRAPAPSPTGNGSPSDVDPSSAFSPSGSQTLSISPGPSAFAPSSSAPDKSGRALRPPVFSISLFSLPYAFLALF